MSSLQIVQKETWLTMYRMKYSQLDANAIEKGTTGVMKVLNVEGYRPRLFDCGVLCISALLRTSNLWYSARLIPAIT